MLDAFHSLLVIIEKDLKANAAETAILKYTEKERKELSDRISHLFQVLASSLKLEYKVSSRGVGVGHARDRLLARVWRYRRLQDSSASSFTNDSTNSNNESQMPSSSTPVTKTSKSSRGKSREGNIREAEDEEELELVVPTRDEDYALLYAYALVTGQLAEEIDKVEREIAGLFGTLDEEMMELY